MRAAGAAQHGSPGAARMEGAHDELPLLPPPFVKHEKSGSWSAGLKRAWTASVTFQDVAVEEVTESRWVAWHITFPEKAQAQSAHNRMLLWLWAHRGQPADEGQLAGAKLRCGPRSGSRVCCLHLLPFGLALLQCAPICASPATTAPPLHALRSDYAGEQVQLQCEDYLALWCRLVDETDAAL